MRQTCKNATMHLMHHTAAHCTAQIRQMSSFVGDNGVDDNSVRRYRQGHLQRLCLHILPMSAPSAPSWLGKRAFNARVRHLVSRIPCNAFGLHFQKAMPPSIGYLRPQLSTVSALPLMSCRTQTKHVSAGHPPPGCQVALLGCATASCPSPIAEEEDSTSLPRAAPSCSPRAYDPVSDAQAALRKNFRSTT